MMINLSHSIEEINAILQALAKRPFEEVADLITKIKTSAMAQLAPAPAPVEAPPAETAPAPEDAETPAQ